MSKTKTRRWDAAEHLKTEADRVAYLEAALEDGDSQLVAVVLGDIARAKGMAQLARDTGLGRESLDKALSAEGNPKFATVRTIERVESLMKFTELVGQVRSWLEREQRVTYRTLQREFELDADTLADLKEELIEAKRVAVDENGKVLVWTGAAPVPSTASSVPGASQSPAPSVQPPSAYTPAHLAERIRATAVTDGERKTITALFADLKGSTALIEGLDPEEARAIIDPALQLMMDAVHQYDGYVAQALGDGIFALFGAPLAHEDHPQRALYAALRMQEAMRRYADTLRAKGYPPLLMRVGINTGEVVLRSIRKDDLHADYVPADVRTLFVNPRNHLILRSFAGPGLHSPADLLQ